MGTIVIGVFCLITGIVLIATRKSAINTAATSIAGMIVAALGVLVIGEELWGLNRIGKILIIWLIGGSLGMVFLYSGCRHLYIKIFCCRENISETFLGIKKHHGFWHSNRHSYTLEFKYRVGGRWYQNESEERYFRTGRLEKNYRMGQEYPIFVSLKKPEIFVIKRRPFPADIMILLDGLMFLGWAIWGTVFLLK